MDFGKPLTVVGQVAAGTDALICSQVASAPRDAHLQVVAMSFVGGDGGEAYGLYLFPAAQSFPTLNVDNGVKWWGGIEGGESIPQPFVGNYLRNGGPGLLMIPAGYTLGICDETGTSAAVFTVKGVFVPNRVA